MATLQQVTKTSRHILVIGSLSIVGIFIIIIIINIIKSLYHPPLPPPTVSFGKLPIFVFPSNVTSTKLHFSFDTISGNLPTFPDRATVYKVQTIQPTLGALQNAKAIVANMGYLSDPTSVSDTKYQWVNTDDLPKKIILNIFTNDFSISSNFLSDQGVLQGNNLPDQNGAISLATSFLQTSTLLPTDIDSSKTKATLLSISNGQLVSATSLSSSQVIKVDLFQKNINNLPIFYPQPTYSTMELFVAGGNNNSQIVAANFQHKYKSEDSSTYPIISVQKAVSELENGEGFVGSYDGSNPNITINNIILGYYMSDKDQNFIEPIIVFEGTSSFFAYIPAVTDSWIGN